MKDEYQSLINQGAQDIINSKTLLGIFPKGCRSSKLIKLTEDIKNNNLKFQTLAAFKEYINKLIYDYFVARRFFFIFFEMFVIIISRFFH